MKILKFLPIILLTILFACNGNSTDQPTEGDITSKEITDQDFNESIKAFEGKEVQDTVVKLKKVAGQGSQKLQSLVAPGSLASCSSIPTKIDSLNSGSGFSIYKFTSGSEASAKAFGFEGSIGKKELLVIEDYVRYRNVECNGVIKKVGIGLRCFVHVKSIKGKLGGTLASIAASVELAKASGEFNIVSLGFGIGGDVIGDIPTQGEYDVTNFGNLAIVFNNVLKTLKNGGDVIIDPVELP